ncbi:MAG: DUF3617 family protein [Gammaproteobacteria bacterium]|nr:DUF3617 family protein [Gammaproteobacteria bacterium]
MELSAVTPGTSSPYRASGRVRGERSAAAGFVMIALTGLAGVAPAAGTPLQPGAYDIAARLIMPHLDGMRRSVINAQRCLRDGQPETLFPVLQQYAFGGCALDYAQTDGDTVHYVLVCESARVATGTATLSATPAGLVGTLAVKMGGKNMTFTQRIEAVRIGECAGATAATTPVP